MKTAGRIVPLLLIYVLFPAVLAYSGVHFSDKPVSWMTGAYLLCLLFLFIGFAWAFRPMSLQFEAKVKRYAVQAWPRAFARVIFFLKASFSPMMKPSGFGKARAIENM